MRQTRKRLRSLPHDVYKIRDSEGALLYVGCSVDAFTRVRQHKYEYQTWFPQAATVDIDQYPNLITARYVEAHSIATENPRGNRQQEAAALFRGDYMNLEPVIIDQFIGIPIAEFWKVAA